MKKILSWKFHAYSSYGSKVISLWILPKISQNCLLLAASKIFPTLDSNNSPTKKAIRLKFHLSCTLPPKYTIFIISFHWKCLVLKLKFIKNNKKYIFGGSRWLFEELWNKYKWLNLPKSCWYCLPQYVSIYSQVR